MTVLDHPIFPHVKRYFHVVESGHRHVDLLELPDQLLALCLGVVCNCVSCGRIVSVFRRRTKSRRARTAGAPEERRLYYSGVCPSEASPGCSRTTAHGDHRRAVLRALGRDA